MRILLAIVILAALGWSGFWWWQASVRDRALTSWLAERSADGWVAQAGDIRVTGFPNRVDAVVTDLDLADPEAGWSWAADEFRISRGWDARAVPVAHVLRHLLETDFGYRVDSTTLHDHPVLGDLRSVFVPGPPAYALTK